MRPGTLVAPPSGIPIPLDALKAHMRVTVTDDDDLITSYLLAAQQYVEESYDRALLTQTWDYPLDAFPWANQSIDLPIWPLQSVTSITYTDSNNTPTVWPSTNYFVDTVRKPGRIVLAYNAGWPSVALRTANGVVIRYVAGYGAAATIPTTTVTALMLLTENWYENREPIIAERGVVAAEIPLNVRALLEATTIAAVS